MAMLALDVDLLVVLDQEKRLLVLPQRIVYVPRIRAVVPMVLLLLELPVPQTVPTFVRRVPVDTTKTATLALGVNLHVVLEQEKQLLVYQHLIVYVPKTFAVVPTV